MKEVDFWWGGGKPILMSNPTQLTKIGVVLRLSLGCDNCATSRHIYLSNKYMFLRTFSNPENMLADKKKTFLCLDVRERQKIKMRTFSRLTRQLK